MKHLAIILVCICMTPTAFSAIINVTPNGGLTIQQAINSASNGDTVLVHPGTYVENISFSNKNITVKSTNVSNPE